MSTDTQTDLSSIVGELGHIPCDFRQHGSHPIHTDEPASHYTRTLCSECGDDTGVMAACPGLVSAVLANLPGRCRQCDTVFAAGDVVTILGPVLS